MKCPKCKITIDDGFTTCPMCGSNIGAGSRILHGFNLFLGQDHYKPSPQQIKKEEDNNIPKCPTCGSSNIERIGVLDRAISIGILGIFSNKINKSYKCRNCKATW